MVRGPNRNDAMKDVNSAGLGRLHLASKRSIFEYGPSQKKYWKKNSRVVNNEASSQQDFVEVKFFNRRSAATSKFQ